MQWSCANIDPWEPTTTLPWLLPCEQNSSAPIPDAIPEIGDGASAERFRGILEWHNGGSNYQNFFPKILGDF